MPYVHGLAKAKCYNSVVTTSCFFILLFQTNGLATSFRLLGLDILIFKEMTHLESTEFSTVKIKKKHYINIQGDPNKIVMSD